MKRSLTGIRPSGNVHLGNYLGMIRPALKRQHEFHCMYFLADMHALTTNKDAGKMKEFSLDLVATWIALGYEHEKHILYRQSDIPMVSELAWYLSCCTGIGLLEKAHAYKDASSQQREVNHGVFAYPVLMAADILMYDPDVVPVGKDQKQHVEMARDMAGSLNALFGEGVLKLPLPQVEEDVMSVPGLDGRKMSKSYGNEIPIFIDEKGLRKLIMSIKTDSTPLEEPKTLAGSLVGDLYKLFASPSQTTDLSTRLLKGGLGWGHAKDELFQVINAYFSEARTRYADLRKDEAFLENVLASGADRAYDIGVPVLNRVRKAVGFGPFRYHR
jgi:tryptophanyl-tRNA synthetase